MVTLEKRPALPRVVASEMTTAELVLAPLITTQFFNVSLVTGVAPTDPMRTTLGVVTRVVVMVRLRSGPTPPIEPSMVTRLEPFMRTRAPANEPVIARATPVGEILTVKLLDGGDSCEL